MARRDPKVERRWRRLIERQERSGRTVRAICETHGVCKVRQSRRVGVHLDLAPHGGANEDGRL
jgi:hypothetical protein